MQDDLFQQDPTEPSAPQDNTPQQKAERPAKRPLGGVRSIAHAPEVQQLGAELPQNLKLGTSSWTYPGWSGLLWDGEVSEPTLSKHGLSAYTEHPLLRTVSLDRAFYRPLSAAQYARYAAQVPSDFRFMVKGPSLVTDALVRGEDGKAMQLNPVFLDPTLAVQEFARPAMDGLGAKLGVLVTRQALAKVIRATTQHGQQAYVTVSNNAEGCAPLSIRALAQAIVEPAPVNPDA